MLCAVRLGVIVVLVVAVAVVVKNATVLRAGVVGTHLLTLVAAEQIVAKGGLKMRRDVATPLDRQVGYARRRVDHERLVERAGADQWMSWAQTTLYGNFNRLFWLTVRTPEKDQNPEKIRSTLSRLIDCYRLLDDRLAKHAYVAGENLSMADIPTGSTLYRYFHMPIERPELSNLQRWYRRLAERDAYRKWVMVSFGELRGRLSF